MTRKKMDRERKDLSERMGREMTGRGEDGEEEDLRERTGMGE